jgi:hypothetical protein
MINYKCKLIESNSTINTINTFKKLLYKDGLFLSSKYELFNVPTLFLLLIYR